MNNETFRMIMKTEETYLKILKKLNEEFQRLRARDHCRIEILKNLRVMIVNEEGVMLAVMRVLLEGHRKKMNDLKKKTMTNEIHLKNTQSISTPLV